MAVERKPDFGGYVTKANVLCTDGVTIDPGAFAHQDGAIVPLVWQHDHQNPLSVLGQVRLSHRQDGLWGDVFLNNTEKAQHAKAAVVHGDINAMSIWANQLVRQASRVVRGSIREVSLVLAGANSGARIDPVTIMHDGFDTVLDDEAIIHTGLPLDLEVDEASESDTESEEEMSEELEHSETTRSVGDVVKSMTEEQREVLYYLVERALTGDDSIAQSDLTDVDDLQDHIKHAVTQALTEMDIPNMVTRNVFDDAQESKPAAVLTHSDMSEIMADATRSGSLADAVNNYAIKHGIEDIEILFPDAQNVTGTPEWDKRRTEWVAHFLGRTTKRPFSRIKTLSADITEDAARAKGYITGTLKKEEFFRVAKRVTTPTTVYKKQKLDRDDMIDITDFDVVAWLKGEMRMMLDEEIARASLLGDGRDVSDEDKINEGNIRPIATDHELYTTTLTVADNKSHAATQAIIDRIVQNRHMYRGSGQPVMYTTEIMIARFLLLKDSLGRRIYKNLEELAAELRVSEIVPVEVMEEYENTLCVLVNPVDYTHGATRGGNVSMFDDFDIDYNQHKYLIETRLCGALTKLRSAIHVVATAATNVEVTPAEPAFDGTEVTITDQTGVLYFNALDDTPMNAAGSPYAVAEGSSVTVYAMPDSGYYFPTSADDSWTFTNQA